MIQVGILGAGNISETHARAVQQIEGAEIVAVYGQNQEKAARLSQLYGGTLYQNLLTSFAHRPMNMVVIGINAADCVRL